MEGWLADDLIWPRRNDRRKAPQRMFASVSIKKYDVDVVGTPILNARGADAMPNDLADFHQFIASRLELGANMTPQEALDEFVAYQRESATLRAMLQSAEDSSAAGKSKPFDAEETKRAVRERFRESNPAS